MCISDCPAIGRMSFLVSQAGLVGKGWIGSDFVFDHWKMRDDIMKEYKIMKAMEKVNAHSLFTRVEDSKTRQHCLKMRELRGT